MELNIKKKALITSVFLVFLSLSLFALDRVPLVVDTDMGLDDMRTILVLLNSPRFSVRAIITVSGSSRAEVGAKNMARLLSHLGIISVPVAPFPERAVAMAKTPPPWREVAENMGGIELSPVIEVRAKQNGEKLLLRVLKEETEPITIIALGPLTNIARFLSEHPELRGKIREIIFSGGNLGRLSRSFNISFDQTAFLKVKGSGIPFRVIGFPEREKRGFPELLRAICEGREYASPVIAGIFSNEEMRRHFHLSDELVALFLLKPDMFRTFKPNGAKADTTCYLALKKGTEDELMSVIVSRLTHLRNTIGHRHYVGVERLFPGDTLLPDIRKVAPVVISRYGLYEWESVMLMNELHQHLGAYSIVGVKMGLYALELLKAGPEEVKVVSEAGSKPPVSCLSDGVMVATGATPGRGLIRVEERGIPSCRFYYQNKVLRLELLPSYRKKIKDEIKSLIARYGNLTPGYFRGVRRFSLKLFREFDRRKIFKVEWLSERVITRQAPPAAVDTIHRDSFISEGK
ncbi:MAG: nucleoside hydrolase [Acidobacteria bacterium]|nr:nucleoside hydrolase [Acidobacteriota bacterium]